MKLLWIATLAALPALAEDQAEMQRGKNQVKAGLRQEKDASRREAKSASEMKAAKIHLERERADRARATAAEKRGDKAAAAQWREKAAGERKVENEAVRAARKDRADAQRENRVGHVNVKRGVAKEHDAEKK